MQRAGSWLPDAPHLWLFTLRYFDPPCASGRVHLAVAMESALTFFSDVSACEDLPDRLWQLRYELDPYLRPVDYTERLQQGWRRVGYAMFRPECPSCRMCQSLRVPVATFRPNSSQRRAWNRNQGEVTVRVGEPSLSEDRLDLGARFHQHGHETKGWPAEAGGDPGILLQNPFPTEEWTYYLGDRLIGVAYVDPLPEGLSRPTATTTQMRGPDPSGRSTSSRSSPLLTSEGSRTSTSVTTSRGVGHWNTRGGFGRTRCFCPMGRGGRSKFKYRRRVHRQSRRSDEAFMLQVARHLPQTEQSGPRQRAEQRFIGPFFALPSTLRLRRARTRRSAVSTSAWDDSATV